MSSAMKSYFRRLAEGYDYGSISQCLKPFLGAAESCYGSGVNWMKKMYDQKVFKRHRLPFPVVSVGNITWGGTGKTPFVEYLSRRVSELQKTPLVLTRGYNHDEVVQFQHHIPQAVLGVGKNRVEVAAKISKEKPVHIAILDDGLQHWPLERDLDIVLVNVLNPFGNGRLIPKGILREPVAGLQRAGVIVLSHVNLISQEEVKKLKEKIRSIAPKANLVESFLEPLFLYRAKTRERFMFDKLQNKPVATFSGVGTPISFQKLVAKLQMKPVLNYEFTDHHEFTEKELLEIKEGAEAKSVQEMITTEKDFFRSTELITKVLNPLVLATRLRIRSGEDMLSERLAKLLGVAKK